MNSSTPHRSPKIDRGAITRLNRLAVAAWAVCLIVPIVGMVWSSTIARSLERAGVSRAVPDQAMRVAAVLLAVETVAAATFLLPVLLG